MAISYKKIIGRSKKRITVTFYGALPGTCETVCQKRKTVVEKRYSLYFVDKTELLDGRIPPV